ncbi:FAD-dependent monooxygenase [Taibaiella lutea]|uniref:FAD-dependent monooxygenase n=1 Tax=Taibaiella lutea TaxID=2608001 RepID=A0A5M6CCA1_9BACT|nr:FAD-dependent monooxygenase [Taibaiella lutea]KAA5532100.1 FAD-dependent monooxygenase [Taibaiella lutea]
MSQSISIIGAGATGLSAAVFLNALGYAPDIFEKRERARITKALGVNPVTLQLFEKSGITQRFLNNGWKMECMNFWYNDKIIYKNHLSKIRHPYPFMLIQPQFETEQILEDYLNEKNIFVKRNFELQHISRQQSKLCLDFQNLNDHTLSRIETDIVLGADGSRSSVRELTAIAFRGREHKEEYTLYDIELETPVSDKEGHYRFYRDGAMLMLPIRDGVWRIGGNLKDVFNYLPKGTKTGKISWETNFTISEKVADKYNKGNIYLLGDAAHIHSPLGAKGMNMCMEDSYVFANLLHQNREKEFSDIRRRKVKNAISALGQITEVAAGQHFIGNTFRSSMKPLSFLFPVFMPFMRKFLLGLK